MGAADFRFLDLKFGVEPSHPSGSASSGAARTETAETGTAAAVPNISSGMTPVDGIPWTLGPTAAVSAASDKASSWTGTGTATDARDSTTGNASTLCVIVEDTDRAF